MFHNKYFQLIVTSKTDSLDNYTKTLDTKYNLFNELNINHISTFIIINRGNFRVKAITVNGFLSNQPLSKLNMLVWITYQSLKYFFVEMNKVFDIHGNGN